MIQKKSIFTIFILILQTSRVGISCISGLLASLILFTHHEYPFLISLFRGVPIIFATMIGFILNDIYDYKKDKLAKKQRPISLDKLNQINAYFGAFLFLIFALLIDVYFADFFAMYVIVLTVLAVWIYSPFSKRFPLFKGFYTAALCCAPLLYGLVLAKSEINIIAFIPIIVFIVGREIMLDIFDFKGDHISGLKTIPIFLGKNLSRTLSWISMYLGGFILISFSQLVLYPQLKMANNIVKIFFTEQGNYHPSIKEEYLQLQWEAVGKIGMTSLY